MQEPNNQQPAPAIEREAPTRRVLVSKRKMIGLVRLASHTQRLKDVLGIIVSPLGQQAMVERLMKTGKPRAYRPRPMLTDPVTGFRQTYGDRRKLRIIESQRQGVEVAKKKRQEYVQRRTDKWRGVVEKNMPVMFNEALADAGIMPVMGGRARTIVPRTKAVVQPKV